MILALLAAQAATPAPIEGLWINPAKSVIIAIAPCREALCGTVRWASTEAQAEARKGTPQLVGTALLTGLVPKGERWRGKLFIPDRKMRATARLALDGGQLKVSGCTLGKLLCRTQLWSRTAEPLPAVP